MTFTIDNSQLIGESVAMPDYEFTFEIPQISEEVEDSIADQLDAVIAEHGGVGTVTVLTEGTDAISAARTAVDELTRLGAAPSRLVDDLVTRTQIAERAGVSRQAVGLWISGQRQSALSFPAPFILTGGGLWLWSEVLPALRELGCEIEDAAEYPSRRDSQIIGGMLAARSRKSATILARLIFESVHVTTTSNAGVRPVEAPKSARIDVALAA